MAGEISRTERSYDAHHWVEARLGYPVDFVCEYKRIFVFDGGGGWMLGAVWSNKTGGYYPASHIEIMKAVRKMGPFETISDAVDAYVDLVMQKGEIDGTVDVSN